MDRYKYSLKIEKISQMSNIIKYTIFVVANKFDIVTFEIFIKKEIFLTCIPGTLTFLFLSI